MHRFEHQDRSGFVVEDDIDRVFGHANANAPRIACPPLDVLNALAKRERPIGDPAYEHVARCSACYRDVRSIQQVISGRRIDSKLLQ